ncbi:MAG TPA: hypothetical protein VE988_07495 [Gemmataceae bacterium]|nr:hypothetical protein [Gemmataceae bacterium]
MPDTSGGELIAVRMRPRRVLEVKTNMKTYEFDVVLMDQSEISDDLADALFAAGCDDGTPVSSKGLAWIHFDRDATSLEEALRSAVAQVRAAGLSVAKVELDVDATMALGA